MIRDYNTLSNQSNNARHYFQQVTFQVELYTKRMQSGCATTSNM